MEVLLAEPSNLAHIMIGITSILITGWPEVSMFIPDNLLTSCPLTFKTWTCAGYNSAWIAAWATGGIEMILWIIASFSTDFIYRH